MNARPEPLVSIVTPCYNGEKYLSECIESVIAQTYGNWEYVIVNNASTDRSLEIAMRYAEKDKRVRVLTNDSCLPAMQNMNHALRQMAPESEYCKVLHADDWMFPECLSRMVEVADVNPTVGVVGSYRLNGMGDKTWVDLDGLPYPGTVVSGREVCRMFLLDGVYIFGAPSALLIRSGLIRKRPRFYNEDHFFSDGLVCFELLRECDFGYVHQVLTYNREHEASLARSAQRFHPYELTKLSFLKQFGSVYLSQEECDKRLEEIMDDYYKYLAKCGLRLAGKQHWEYNLKGLKALGHPFSVWKLIRAYFLEGTKPARLFVSTLREGLKLRSQNGK